MLRIIRTNDDYFACKLNIIIAGFFITIYSTLLLIKFHSDNHYKIKLYSSFGLITGLLFMLCCIFKIRKNTDYYEQV